MIKKIVFMGATLLLIFLGLGGFCGFAAAGAMRGVLNGLEIGNWKLEIAQWCFGGLPLVEKLDKILDNKTYIVVLQNNTELRASGGFMGSYAKINVQCPRHAGGQAMSNVQCGIKKVEIEDIYQPDGQLVGYVEPPAPIKQAFPFGSWKLRDSNWDVDFSVAGEQIAWFLEQGLPAGRQGGEHVDGVIAVNLSLVNKMLEILGGVKTVTYDERVTAQNLANLAQTYSEVNKDKRDFLGAVGAALFERIKQSSPMEQIKLAKLIYDQLQKGQILIWTSDQQLGWGGSLGNYGGDYLYIVESNLGANKANCCVTRSVVQSIDGDKEKLSIRWENSSQFSDPKPPVFWGGNYIDYVRVVVPAAAQIKDAEKYDIETRGTLPAGRQGFKIVGFWATVPAGQMAVAELVYDLPASGQILVRRQPGIDSFPYKLVVDGKVVVNENIDRDKEFTY